MRTVAATGVVLTLLLGVAGWQLGQPAGDQSDAHPAGARDAEVAHEIDGGDAALTPDRPLEPPGTSPTPGPVPPTAPPGVASEAGATSRAPGPVDGSEFWPAPTGQRAPTLTDLAGVYRLAGTGYGSGSLTLRLDGSYTDWCGGCTGESTGQGRWSLDATGPAIRFDPPTDSVAADVYPGGRRLPMRWGSAIVLLPTHDGGMADFMNVLHGRWSDPERLLPVSERGFIGGVPELPSSWAALLRRRPLAGTVVRAQPTPAPANPPEPAYRVVPPPGKRWLFDRGSDQGVFVGMWLRSVAAGRAVGAEVIAVTPSESEIESAAHLPLAVGDTLESGVFHPR